MNDSAGLDPEFERELMARPRARLPATMEEVAASAWSAGALDTLGGVAKVKDDVYREFTSKMEGVTGKSVSEMARERGINLNQAQTLDQLIGLVEPMADSLPDADKETLKPFRDITRRARERAQKIETDASDVAGATYGLSGLAASFAGSTARMMADPFNLAAMGVTLPMGGPLAARFGSGVLGVALREGITGGVVQAMQQPGIEQVRGELGLEAGFAHGLESIGQAAIGGAVVSGGLKIAGKGVALAWQKSGAAAAYRDAAGRMRERFATGEPLPPAVHGLAPEDFDALALHAEREHFVETAASPPTAAAAVDTTRAVERASADMAMGKPIEPDPKPIRSLPDPWGAVPEGRTLPGDETTIIRPNGGRLGVRYEVRDFSELVVSHNLDGVENKAFPSELQPRDRTAAASVTWVADKAKTLEPELLARSPLASYGAPIVNSGGVIESGNGRALVLEKAYRDHPDKAQAYKDYISSLGYDIAGMDRPIMVRTRIGELVDQVGFTREANVGETAALSTRERAFADASRLDVEVLSLWRGGDANQARNIQFLRAFVDRIVAPEERPQFVDAQGRLSADGMTRVEAALVARAWGEHDIVSSLYEAPSPTSRAILGALADTAPEAARLKFSVAAGHVPAVSDPTGSILAAFRLVEKSRASGDPLRMMLDQIDFETGVVPPDVQAAVRLFFRDDALRQPAGRERVGQRIAAAIDKAMREGEGNLFGEVADSASLLRASTAVGEALDELPLLDVVDQPALMAEPSSKVATPSPEGSVTVSSARVGDAALAADMDRLLQENGGDLSLVRAEPQPGGGTLETRVSFRDSMIAIEEQAGAADELAACIAGNTTEIAS